MTTFEIIGEPYVVGSSTFFTYRKKVTLLGMTVLPVATIDAEARCHPWYHRYEFVDVATGNKHSIISHSHRAFTAQLRDLGCID